MMPGHPGKVRGANEIGNAKEIITLSRLLPGRRGIVKSLEIAGITRRRLLDLGLIPGAVVETVRKSPAGNPIAYKIRGAIVALRLEQGDQVYVQPL